MELGGPDDLDLTAYRRIAWDGEAIELSPPALERVADRRRAFEAFVGEHASERLYGITTAHHRGAGVLLTPEAQVAYARRIPPTPATFGPPLPERVVRGIVAARVAGFLGEGAAVRPELVQAVAGMLAGPLPTVPARGHGDPGEIIVLRALFGHLEDVVALEAKEGMALANGAPAAAAALADGALAGRGRLRVAEELLALAVEAVRAPHAQHDPALDRVWGDPYEGAALARLRALLDGGDPERRAYQAAVAFRNAPRTLGWAGRVQAQAEACAEISLRAPGDNPSFLGPGPGDAAPRIASNAGYHDPRAAPSLNALAAAWADLAGLAAVQATRLAEDPAGLIASEPAPRVSLLSMTALGWAEEARVAAAPTLMSLGGSPPSDTSSPALLAWRLADDVGTCLEAVLAVLAVLALHTIDAAGRPVPPALDGLAAAVRAAFDTDVPPGGYGPALAAVAAELAHRVRTTDAAVAG